MSSRAASLVLRNLSKCRAASSIVAKRATLSRTSLQRATSTNEATSVRTFSDITPTGDSSLKKTSSDGVVGDPIDFNVASKIEGNESQIVTIALEPGQVLRAESGALMYMEDGVEMETTTGGGMSAGFKRMMTGQNVFISDYTYKGEPGTKGHVALGTDFPSKIIRLNVDEYGGKIVCQKGALLCASHTIDIEMEFAKKMTTGCTYQFDGCATCVCLVSSLTLFVLTTQNQFSVEKGLYFKD